MTQPVNVKDNELLEKIGLDKAHCAITGLQWGDEGKGKIVDLLCAHFDYVVRYNGGSNAGHTIVVDDQRYALHLIPSGILYPDKINVLGNGVVIDLGQIVKEITELKQRGIDIKDNLRISERAHIVFEYHKVEDALLEKAAAKARGEKSSIGTTGRGIGPCYSDKALRTTAVRAGDLLDKQKLKEKLTQIIDIKNATLDALAKYSDQDFKPFNIEQILEQTLSFADTLGPFITDASGLLQRAIKENQTIVFEGANATLLDIDHGTYPYVTSSNCSSLGVHTGSGVAGRYVKQVVGIAKAYQTRVGGGPMPTELDNAIGEKIRQKGKEFGTTTGRPRRCGWLDLAALKYSASISGATGIALMLLDVLCGLEQIKVCTGYKLDGKPIDHFPASAQTLEQVEPVYETLEGFNEPIEQCTSFEQLPKAAKAYIKYIEDFINVPISIISVGPKRSQTIIRLTNSEPH